MVVVIGAPNEGQLTVVNAGHHAGLIWSSSKKPEPLASSGPMLSSIFRTPQWNEVSIPIGQGHHVLLYTDGVSEAFLVDNGEERIKAAIDRHANGGGPLLDAIVADVDRHRGHHPYRDHLPLGTGRVVG